MASYLIGAMCVLRRGAVSELRSCAVCDVRVMRYEISGVRANSGVVRCAMCELCGARLVV